MAVQEALELNDTLADLGIPPIIIDAKPISTVFEQDLEGASVQKEPIDIPSDTEEAAASKPNCPLNPLEETNLSSAMVVYFGLVNFQTLSI